MRALLCLILMAAFVTACSPTAEDHLMTDWPEIRDVWDFNDPAASEVRFRELAAQADAAGDETFRAEALTQVARTFSLRNQFGDANDVLDEVEGGPAARHPRVQVRLLLERGRTLNSGGDGEAALALFEQAIPIARDTGEHFLAGDAIHMAAIAADIEGEAHWIQVLEDYIASDPNEGSIYWRGAMHNNMGWSYFYADRFEEAAEEFRQSGAAYAAMDGQRFQALIADYALGRALYAQGRAQEALALQEAAYAALDSELDMQDEFVAAEIALIRAELGDNEGAQPFARLAYDKLSTQGWFAESEADRLEALRVLAGD